MMPGTHQVDAWDLGMCFLRTRGSSVHFVRSLEMLDALCLSGHMCCNWNNPHHWTVTSAVFTSVVPQPFLPYDVFFRAWKPLWFYTEVPSKGLITYGSLQCSIPLIMPLSARSILQFFFFFFFDGIGIWTQGLTLLGRQSTIWATLQPSFVLSIFEIGSLKLFP
jgi:hypothetical protein